MVWSALLQNAWLFQIPGGAGVPFQKEGGRGWITIGLSNSEEAKVGPVFSTIAQPTSKTQSNGSWQKGLGGRGSTKEVVAYIKEDRKKDAVGLGSRKLGKSRSCCAGRMRTG